MTKPHAQPAARNEGSLVDRVVRFASKAMASRCGARGAAESGTAPTTTPKKKEAPMKTKVSSARVAAIASKILRDQPVTHRDVKAVAASVVAQAKAAKRKKAPAKKRR